MKLLLLLPLLVLLIGCAATAPIYTPVPSTNMVFHAQPMHTAYTNWIPSGLWTDTGGRIFSLERCYCVSNGVPSCQSEWFRLNPNPTSGTFPTNLPDPMLKQFYPPIPPATRPYPPRDPLNHP